MSNPSYNVSGEIMMNFVMYTVSDSDKRGAKGVCDSAMYKCNNAMTRAKS